MGDDTSPNKRRAKYDLRERTNPPFSDAIYDAELEETLKALEREDSSPVQSYPQSPQRAPVAPMMSNMDVGSSENQPARPVGSADSSQNQTETMPKSKPVSSSGSSQMPPPPRASKKTPSPQQKPPKLHRVILKTAKGSLPSAGTSKRAHTTSGTTTGVMSPTAGSLPQPKSSSTPLSSHQSSEAASSSKVKQKTNVPIDAETIRASLHHYLPIGTTRRMAFQSCASSRCSSWSNRSFEAAYTIRFPVNTKTKQFSKSIDQLS